MMQTIEDIIAVVSCNGMREMTTERIKQVAIMYAEQQSKCAVSIEDRKNRFTLSLADFKDEYPRQMLVEFRNYWCEHSQNGKKMRFEKEKVFDIKLRLIRWNKNSRLNEKPTRKTGHDIEGISSAADTVLREHYLQKYQGGDTE